MQVLNNVQYFNCINVQTKYVFFFLILTFNNRLYWSHKKAFLIHRPTSNNLRSTNYPRWHQHPRDCSRSIPCWSAENTSINNMLSFLTIQNFLKLSILVITLTSIYSAKYTANIATVGLMVNLCSLVEDDPQPYIIFTTGH